MTPETNPNTKSVEERTREVIDAIRPYIQADGGDIEFVEVKDGNAHVRLHGACAMCPHAAMTLQMGVEKNLRERVPEIQHVVNVT